MRGECTSGFEKAASLPMWPKTGSELAESKPKTGQGLIKLIFDVACQQKQQGNACNWENSKSEKIQ